MRSLVAIPWAGSLSHRSPTYRPSGGPRAIEHPLARRMLTHIDEPVAGLIHERHRESQSTQRPDQRAVAMAGFGLHSRIDLDQDNGSPPTAPQNRHSAQGLDLRTLPIEPYDDPRGG